MKPDRIQFAPQLGNGQGIVIHQVVKRYPAANLYQAALLAGVFSDLVNEPSAHQVAMVVEPHQLTLIVAAADGGALTEAEHDLIEAFDSIHAMVMEEQEEEDDLDDDDFDDDDFDDVIT